MGKRIGRIDISQEYIDDFGIEFIKNVLFNDKANAVEIKEHEYVYRVFTITGESMFFDEFENDKGYEIPKYTFKFSTNSDPNGKIIKLMTTCERIAQ